MAYFNPQTPDSPILAIVSSSDCCLNNFDDIDISLNKPPTITYITSTPTQQRKRKRNVKVNVNTGAVNLQRRSKKRLAYTPGNPEVIDIDSLPSLTLVENVW